MKMVVDSQKHSHVLDGLNLCIVFLNNLRHRQLMKLMKEFVFWGTLIFLIEHLCLIELYCFMVIW